MIFNIPNFHFFSLAIFQYSSAPILQYSNFLLFQYSNIPPFQYSVVNMKPKLLIVEDDESIRTQMKWALAQDYEVFLAEDRERALEITRNERPAVVTLDLGLPPHPADVDEGFAALSEISPIFS